MKERIMPSLREYSGWLRIQASELESYKGISAGKL